MVTVTASSDIISREAVLRLEVLDRSSFEADL
jgi:hypothetical protein